MTITVTLQKTKQLLRPKDFKMGKVYQSIDTPTCLVLGTREIRMESPTILRGVQMDDSATPWFHHDTKHTFIEIDITVIVED